MKRKQRKTAEKPPYNCGKRAQEGRICARNASVNIFTD